ncbi:phosphoribosyl-ATP diphosphatase [Clostridium brassicae]|uniref:Phosphoribosyl-ATP pyrophosphatase n=1 Tax=Clostridium brassicae TaxID=2999072 RepID=A0ABT4DDW3_9CLOT|nr:phosphoribosyl-ATP diphosphatase [Clostridium brassicae]MCY6960505.1 phosphoribosyl-ATP diphosphatase [Clostridium brassicae]
MSKDIITELYSIIESRKRKKVENSYTNYLFEKGLDKILKKVGEESTEVVLAAKNNNNEELILEICDLIYHSLVLMAEVGITTEEIKEELKKRREKIGNNKKERRQIDEY